MLFSVVIPTHDRLHLLRDAIETVRRQKGAEWELAVFDNASTDPLAEHVASLNDPRVRYARSDEFLPVTDSWNRAIDLARGDYIILLGDDDGLVPGALETLQSIVTKFDRPDVIYSAIYQFMHPGVAPWNPAGYVTDLKNGFFFVDRQSPFRLSPQEAHRAVAGSLGFRRNFTFNMQAFAFSSSFLSRLRGEGPIFQSPFPDYYLANVAFALSKSTIAVPEPLAIAGVSKASFGYTLFNGLEEKGATLLNSKLASDPIYLEIEPKLLRGPSYIGNYVVTMEYVARAIGKGLGESVDYGRYRRLQIFSALQARQMGLPGGASWPDIEKRLSFGERIWAWVIALALRAGARSGRVKSNIVDRLERRVALYGFDPIQRVCDSGSFTRAIDVFEALESGAIPPSSLAIQSV